MSRKQSTFVVWYRWKDGEDEEMFSMHTNMTDVQLAEMIDKDCRTKGKFPTRIERL